MGQYVTRNGKTYYKADSGKLYKDYLAATLAMDSTVGEDVQRLGRATGRALSGLGTAIQRGLGDPGFYQREMTPGQIPGQLPADYKRAELLAAGQIPGQLPADYKETELRAGQLAEQYRPGAGFPGQQAVIVTGLTPAGEVDRSQSDEYKSIRAQYDKARKELPAAEVLDKGLELWAKANPVLAQKLQEQAYLAPLEKGPDGMRTATYNPLMQSTFGYQTGQAPGQFQPNYEGEELIAAYGGQQSPNPLVQQEMQQQATADQAAQATTAGMSVRDKAEDLINRFNQGNQTPIGFQTKRVF